MVLDVLEEKFSDFPEDYCNHHKKDSNIQMFESNVRMFEHKNHELYIVDMCFSSGAFWNIKAPPPPDPLSVVSINILNWLDSFQVLHMFLEINTWKYTLKKYESSISYMVE